MEVDELDVQGVYLSDALDDVLVFAIDHSVLDLFPEIILPALVMPFAQQLQESEDQDQIGQALLVLLEIIGGG